MEYTKDIVFNVKYVGKVEKIKLRDRKWTSKLIRIYEDNKFIIITLLLTTILIVLDLCMVSNFIKLLMEL